MRKKPHGPAVPLIAVDRKGDVRKIRSLDDSSRQRRDDVLGKGGDDIIERCADGDADREVDDVAAQDEFLESVHGRAIVARNEPFVKRVKNMLRPVDRIKGP